MPSSIEAMSEPVELEARRARERPTVRLAIGLCVPIILALLALNTLRGQGEEVEPSQFGDLVDGGLVEEIRLEGNVLRGLLRHPVLLAGTRGQTEASEVVARSAGPPAAADLAAWRQKGIRVVDDGEGGMVGEWLWGGAVVLVLGLASAHLLLRARSQRRYGGPRQRLADAEKRLLNGELSREEFDRLATTISMEM